MSTIFNAKMSDEGLLSYVWIAIAVTVIVLAGAIYQCHVKIDETERSIYDRQHEQADVIRDLSGEVTENKNLIITSIQQSKDTEVRVEQLSSQVTGIERTARRMEESSEQFSTGVSELRRVSEGISELFSMFDAREEDPELEALEEELEEPEESEDAEVPELSGEESEEKPLTESNNSSESEAPQTEEEVEPRGKRIWWTLWLLRRKP